MNQYLIYIKKIINTILEGEVLTHENLKSYFILNKKASNDELLICDKFFNQKLPIDYITFLQHYNGGVLFKVEDFGGYKFLSAEEIIKENQFQKENFGEDWDESIILFCVFIGDGEFLGFRIKEGLRYDVIHCIPEILPQEWVVIESSFEILMNKLIEAKGRKYWLDN